MSVEGRNYSVTVKAGADLSALQHRIITVAGTLATTNILAAGVLNNKPQLGEHAALAYQGEMKAYAGGAIAAGNALTMTLSGTLAAATITSSHGIVGKAMAAATSGSLVQFIGNFATAF